MIFFIRSHIAVAEKGEKPRISVFCLKSRERLKLLGNPYKDMKAKDYAGLDFTRNGNYLLALLGKPDFEMLQYEWQRGKVINRVQIHPKRAPVSSVSTPTRHKSLSLSSSIYFKISLRYQRHSTVKFLFFCL